MRYHLIIFTMRNRKHIRVDGLNVVDKYNANYAEFKLSENIYTSVYKVTSERRYDKDSFEFYQFTLTPGFVDLQERFFQISFAHFYVQLHKIVQIDPPSGSRNVVLNISLTIYSQDYRDFFDIDLEIEGYQPLDFMKVNEIVNIICKYVSSGRNIHQLDTDKLSKQRYAMNDKYIIIETVENLKIQFYENSISRVGKDNLFLTEAQIWNLPSDKYLSKLIENSLSKIYTKAQRVEDKLKFTLRSYHAYEAAHEISLLEDSQSEEREVKEKLKMEMAINYNSEDQLMTSLEK